MPSTQPLILTHPAPTPTAPPQFLNPSHKKIPPKPKLSIKNSEKDIIVQWRIDDLNTATHADIDSYENHSYEINDEEPSTNNWVLVGDVKALLLPMAVTLSEYGEGQSFYFAVRAVDCHKRVSEFSEPKTWEN